MAGEQAMARRRAVRREALANLLLTLMTDAERSSGRFLVEPWVGGDAVLLGFLDVRTLVRHHGLYGLDRRDVAVAIACPRDWPFDRAAALQALVLEPDDWAHPNSTGREVCLDLAGIVPGRLAETIYDVLRLRRMRLDHVLDGEAAAFVRSRLGEMPSDPRPLLAPPPSVEQSPPPRVVEAARVPLAGDLERALRPLATTLACVNSVVGVLAPRPPMLDEPAFLRLAVPAGEELDLARATYLLRSRRPLRACVAAWSNGPGVVVDPATAERHLLLEEMVQITRGLEALGDPVVARSYLELCPPNHRDRGGTTT